MNVLPDTSAWSLLLRRRIPEGAREHPVARTLRVLIEGEHRVFLTGIVYRELLQGVRLDPQRTELVHRLRPFPMLYPTREGHERAARLHDRCLRGGAAVSTVDALIA